MRSPCVRVVELPLGLDAFYCYGEDVVCGKQKCADGTVSATNFSAALNETDLEVLIQAGHF